MLTAGDFRNGVTFEMDGQVMAPCISRSVISRSSSALDTVILHSGQPASSSIWRARRVR